MPETSIRYQRKTTRLRVKAENDKSRRHINGLNRGSRTNGKNICNARIFIL